MSLQDTTVQCLWVTVGFDIKLGAEAGRSGYLLKAEWETWGFL